MTHNHYFEEVDALPKGIEALHRELEEGQEQVLYLISNMNLAYSDVDPQMAVGPEVFSGASFQQVRQCLVVSEAQPQPAGGGNSCGV